MNKSNAILALALAAFSSASLAQVSVRDAWARATVPQQKSTGVFMQITSPAEARLVEVRSSAAATVEMHEMTMDRDVMRMRSVQAIDLPAGRTVELKPGGYHVMLLDVKRQIKEGERIPVTLVVETKDKQRSTMEIEAVVRPLNQAAGNTSAKTQHEHGMEAGKEHPHRH